MSATSRQTRGQCLDMYLNTNTLEGFKHNYKYFSMQKYLNTNTLIKKKVFKYIFKYFSFSRYITICKKANHISRHLILYRQKCYFAHTTTGRPALENVVIANYVTVQLTQKLLSTEEKAIICYLLTQ